jgi:hypothetical protein
MEAEVDGRVLRVALGRHLFAEEDVAREVEAEIGCQPRERQDEQDAGERDPQPVAPVAAYECGPVTPDSRDDQPDGDGDAERGQRVDPARIQVVLVDDARNRDERTEADRRPDERPRAARDRRERDPDERDRIVEDRQRA